MTQEELAKKLVAKPDTKHDRMPLLKGRKHEVKVTARTIKRWEKGLTPIPYYQRELARVFEKDVRELGYPKKGIPFWKVPHHRNLFFTGREDVFLELHSAVELRNQQYKQDEKSSIEIDEYGITQPQALVGLGGIGKTQIAIEYAYRYSHDYQTVIWLNARSTEALELEFAAIPILLNLPEKEEANQA